MVQTSMISGSTDNSQCMGRFNSIDVTLKSLSSGLDGVNKNFETLMTKLTTLQADITEIKEKGISGGGGSGGSGYDSTLSNNTWTKLVELALSGQAYGLWPSGGYKSALKNNSARSMHVTFGAHSMYVEVPVDDSDYYEYPTTVTYPDGSWGTEMFKYRNTITVVLEGYQTYTINQGDSTTITIS